MEEIKEIIYEQQDPVIFWLHNYSGESVSGFKYPNPLCSQFKDLIDKGLTPVAIRYDGSGMIDIIVDKDENLNTYIEKQKAIQAKLKKPTIE